MIVASHDMGTDAVGSRIALGDGAMAPGAAGVGERHGLRLLEEQGEIACRGI